jgi:trans-aconitate methyltransferase
LERRFTFSEVSDLYSVARPLYPDSLFDDVVATVDLEADDTILEIGCGTGQATGSLARRGLHIVALDPGQKLLDRAQEQLADFRNIRFVKSTFEAWSPEPATFKMVVAAQAFHWVAPEVRFSKAASVLTQGGALVVFGNVPRPLEPLLRDKFGELYDRFAPSLKGAPPEAWYLPSGPFAELLDKSKFFASPIHKCYPWSRIHTASSYTDLLRTLSGYRMLEAAQREALLDEIAGAIVRHGGQFELPYETHLFMAHRK